MSDHTTGRPTTPTTTALRVTGLDITVHLVAEDGTEHRQVISSAGWKLGTLEIDIDDKFPDMPTPPGTADHRGPAGQADPRNLHPRDTGDAMSTRQPQSSPTSTMTPVTGQTTPARQHRRYHRARLAPATVVIYRESDPWARPERLRLRVLRITAALVVLDHADGPAQFDRSTGWGCRAARGGLGAGASGRDWSAWRISQSDWSRVYVENDSATRRDYGARSASDTQSSATPSDARPTPPTARES